MTDISRPALTAVELRQKIEAVALLEPLDFALVEIETLAWAKAGGVLETTFRELVRLRRVQLGLEEDRNRIRGSVTVHNPNDYY